MPLDFIKDRTFSSNFLSASFTLKFFVTNMSFSGVYNITLNNGSPSANSAIVSTDGVKLVAIDKNDPKQKV